MCDYYCIYYSLLCSLLIRFCETLKICKSIEKKIYIFGCLFCIVLLILVNKSRCMYILFFKHIYNYHTFSFFLSSCFMLYYPFFFFFNQFLNYHLIHLYTYYYCKLPTKVHCTTKFCP